MCVCVLIKSTHSFHKVQFFCYPTKLPRPISSLSLSFIFISILIFYFSFILLNQFLPYAGSVGMGVGLSTGEWVATSGASLKNTDSPALNSHLVPEVNICGEICWPPPCFRLDFLSHFILYISLHAVIATLSSCV